MSTSWYMRIDLPFDGTPDEAKGTFEHATRQFGFTFDGRGDFESLDDHIPFRTTGDALGIFGPGTEPTFTHGRIRCDMWLENLGRSMDTIDVDGVDVPDPRDRIEVLFDELSAIVTAEPGDIVGSINNEHNADRGPIVMTREGLRWCGSNGDVHQPKGWFGADREPHDPICRIPVDLIDAKDTRWRQCFIDRAGLDLYLDKGSVALLRHIADRKAYSA